MKEYYLNNKIKTHKTLLIYIALYIFLFMFLRIYIVYPQTVGSKYIENTEFYERLILSITNIYNYIYLIFVFNALLILYQIILNTIKKMDDSYIFILNLLAAIIGYLLSYFILNSIFTLSITNYLLPTFNLFGKFVSFCIMIVIYFAVSIVSTIYKELKRD